MADAGLTHLAAPSRHSCATPRAVSARDTPRGPESETGQAAAEDDELLEPLLPLPLDLAEELDELEEEEGVDESAEDVDELEPFADPEPLPDEEEDDRLSVR
jgi:hypothetical protein